MKITTETLHARGACQDGIDAFATEFPGGLDVREWTVECQLGVMMHPALRRYLGWAWGAGILPQWSMRGWVLAGAYLAGADLTGADLAGADLTRANLTRANLTRANLTRANLASAGITGADLTRARGAFRPPPDGWICVDGLLRRDQ